MAKDRQLWTVFTFYPPFLPFRGVNKVEVGHPMVEILQVSCSRGVTFLSKSLFEMFVLLSFYRLL